VVGGGGRGRSEGVAGGRFNLLSGREVGDKRADECLIRRVDPLVIAN
jgi:hypothetical protein